MMQPIDKSWLRSFVLSIVKPMKSGKIVDQSGTQASMDNIQPEGLSRSFRLTSPFGLISKIPVGVTGFYNNLFGSGHESIIVALMHRLRPEPTGLGETVLYSTDASGNTIKVKISLKNDGSLVIDCPTSVTVNAPNATINAATKTVINSPAVEIGSGALEKVLNGETFQTFFNEHTHIGNLGYPTSPPNSPSIPAHLSNKVKAAK